MISSCYHNSLYCPVFLQQTRMFTSRGLGHRRRTRSRPPVNLLQTVHSARTVLPPRLSQLRSGRSASDRQATDNITLIRVNTTVTHGVWLHFLNWGFVFWSPSSNVHEVYTVNHLLVPVSLVHGVLRAVSYAVSWPILFAS